MSSKHSLYIQKEILTRIINRDFIGKSFVTETSLSGETIETPLYRGCNGKRDIIGFLIPDDYYSQSFEMTNTFYCNFYDIYYGSPELRKFDYTLLTQMRNAHYNLKSNTHISFQRSLLLDVLYNYNG